MKFKFLDAGASIFFTRDLETIASKTYDQPFPELKAMSGDMPITNNTGADGATYTFRSYTEMGVARFVSDYADNAPRIDIKGEEESIQIRSIEAAYGYSVMDIRFSARQGISLSPRKAIATRRANESLMNKAAWLARPADPQYEGSTGLFYNPNITSYKVEVEGANYAWADKTPAAIIKDIVTLVNTPIILTNGIEIPDTFRCPLEQFSHISATKIAADSDLTILDWVKKVCPQITSWGWLQECKNLPVIPSTGVAATTSIAIVYKNSEEKFSLEIPVLFEQFPPEARNLEYVITCLSRFGGVVMYYPLSVALAEGI